MSHSTSHILLKGELYEALIEVRDLIAGGWIRGAMRLGNRYPRYCLLGAVREVAEQKGEQLFKPMLYALDFEVAWQVSDWNDYDASGQSEVIERIDDAIRKVVETT